MFRPSLMDKTREEFIVWIRQASADPKSGAYNELYQFLVSCFVRADVNLDGQVELSEFDALIEEAAELPRRYGYAPKSSDLYGTDGLRKAARAKQFLDMDTDNAGYITLDKWIKYATTHIAGKVTNLPKDYLGGTASDVTKDEFIRFIRKSVDRNTAEYRELYFFLLKTFQDGDENRTGEVGPVAFDKMIEAAALAPRRFDLAPKSSAMFANDAVSFFGQMRVFSYSSL